MPDADTLMDWVVAPVDHRYEDPAEAVSVADEPEHTFIEPAGLIVGVGGVAPVVTEVAADTAVHPPAFVTVTM